LGIIYQALGETERAHLYTAHGFERARRYGVRYSLGWLHWNFGVIALTRADWSTSTSHLQEAMREAEATENARLKPIALQALAELSFRQGRWHEAETYFQESIRVAANTEWYPSAMALYGHFLAVTGRRATAKVQLDRAAACLEPPGYGGDFYIPFLAEGYLHLEESEQAAVYIERIRSLRGFMYYGNSVDRILGVMATLAGDWEMAERAFEDGVALCRRATNQPEEAAILYEWARTALLQSRNLPTQSHLQQQALRRVVSLCSQARTLFLQYTMQRAVDLVDTLQAGVQQLEQSKKTALLPQEGQPRQEVSGHIRLQGRSIAGQSEYHLDLNLTRREQEVLRLVAEGHTDREVAEILVISPRTVNRHLSNMYIKLDVPGRAGAVAFAIRQGLV
jgi:DNA-binding CsgD family transcriptional regulator/Tfp pilus assembly protein PilF